MKVVVFFLLLFSARGFSYERFEHPTEFIVFLKTSITEFRTSIKNRIDHSGVKIRSLGTNKQALLSVPLGFKVEEFKNELANNTHIDQIVENFVYIGDYREFIPNDPNFHLQDHHRIIKSARAWEQNQGEHEVIVAVTDDGFKLDHEDLINSWYVNEKEIADNGVDDDNNGYVDDHIGYDFNENDHDPSSDERFGSHGTHVAGIVGAGFNNGIGVTGFGTHIKVMPLKFYGKNTWTSAMILESYTYAANNGAKIISTSYYIDNFVGDTAYEKALKYVYSKGLIIFNSAGNGNTRQSRRTAFTRLLLVASTKSKKSWTSSVDQKSSFSNYGRGVDISAPGDPIYSTGRSLSYVELSGTSMAAPVVAGIAALIWSVDPNLTRDQVVAKLTSGATNINHVNPKYKDLLGAGRVDVSDSMNTEIKAPKILGSRYIAKAKKLKIHLKGILSSASFSRNGAITLTKISKHGTLKGLPEDVGLANHYYIGTNELVINVREKGEFELKIDSQKVVDPFGQEIDGDGNGQSGGDYVFRFNAR